MATRTQSAGSGWKEAWGILLLAVFLLLSLSLISYDWHDISLLKTPPNSPPCNFIGPAGAWVSFILFVLLGMGAYLVPVWCLFFGLMFIVRSVHTRQRAIWGGVAMVALIGLLDLQSEWWSPWCERLNLQSAAGGFVAQAVVGWLSVRLLGTVGTTILLTTVFVAALVMFFGAEVVRTWLLNSGLWCAYAFQKGRLALMERRNRQAEEAMETPRLVQAPRVQPAVLPESRGGTRPPPKADAPPPAVAPPVAEKPAPVRKPAVPPAAAAPKAAPRAAKATGDGYQLPPLDLLEKLPPDQDRAIRGDTETTGRVICETLAEFGIQTEIVQVELGPVVTRYELRPAAGVRVERISGLSNNLALSLKATSVRVQAPIPGKGVVGIEVPNSTASMVYLRELMEGEVWHSSKAALPLVLGKDVGGNDIVADLAAMPHLLIAGATGSGKTVCMNSILAGLLMSRTPEQLHLMLIDPKIVEFSGYKHLPHLVGSRKEVITDPKRVASGLRWTINEMERRYKLFAKAGVRNIAGYNSRPIEKQTELFGDAGDSGEKQPEGPLPYIVIIIDELADLMLMAQAEIENCIARLAQLSRAVGIHMILATQRPSVNVITGTIKANFPARIAFQVAQKVDSRTILDANGADKLLGRGDMLFLPPGSSKLVRAQGAMTTDDEIHRIVEFIKKQSPEVPEPIEEPVKPRVPAPARPAEMPGESAPAASVRSEPAVSPVLAPPAGLTFDEMLDGAGTLDGDDDAELIEKAVQIIRETQRASTSSLQRRLRIGYTRAARIMDLLEERGIVGPPCGSDPREILIDLNGEMPNNQPENEGG